MNAALAFFGPLLLVVSGCSLLQGAAQQPVDPTTGGVTTPLPGGGSVTVIPPPAPTEPIETGLPGGGSVVVTPGPAPTTGGGVAGNILGGLLGAFTGNPLLGTLGAAAVNGLLGKLLA